MSKSYIVYLDVAPQAEGDAFPSAVGASAFSDETVLPKGKNVGKVATGELNQWVLDGEHEFLDYDYVAFWSEELSDENCMLYTQPTIDILFSMQHSSTGITIEFDPDGGNYCSEINVKWYQAGELLSDMDFQPDSTKFFCQNMVTAYDEILITLNKTSLPRRRAKINKIYFGRTVRFDMKDIRSASIIQQSNLISAELPISTMDLSIDGHGVDQFMFQAKQPLQAWHDDQLVATRYIDEHTRKSANVYDISSVDAWGVLDESSFAGGYYEGASALSILRSIVEPQFALDVWVDDVYLTGVIEPCTKREAAQQVLFAAGWITSTTGTDSIRVFKPRETEAYIDNNSAYDGATTTISALVTEVRVSAHTYTLDNSGSVEVGGKKYKDSVTVFSVKNPDTTANDKENVIEVDGATLVSPDIGQSVAERVFDYYQKRSKDEIKVVWSGESVGDYVGVPTAWGVSHDGHIEKITIKLSNTVAANLEIIGLGQEV